MQLIVILSQVLPIQTGSGKNGEWKKQDIIVETEGQFPKKICVSVWGDKINESQLKIGSKLKIDFDVESREYNGKWYTDIKAWKVELMDDNNLIESKNPLSDENVTLENEDEMPF
jgi:hypothetical protein